VSPVKYELSFYISEDAILHSHRRETLKSYTLRVDLRSSIEAIDLVPYPRVRVSAIHLSHLA
jgi:hypothetical protein